MGKADRMAFCEMCGAPLTDDAKFCEHCGARVESPATTTMSTAVPTGTQLESAPMPQPAPAPKPTAKRSAASASRSKGEQVTKNIVLCPDGVYRWSYEMNMLRNPTIMFSVWKAIGLSIGIVMVFMLIMEIISGDFDGLGSLAFLGQLLAIIVGIFLVLSIIAYLILGALYGWKYQVLFEMTEDAILEL